MNPIIENNIIYVPKRATMEDSSILGDGYVPLTDVSEEEQKRWREYMKSNETISSIKKSKDTYGGE